MPEGKARSRKLSKNKGSILRVWRAAWFPTVSGFGLAVAWAPLGFAGRVTDPTFLKPQPD